MNKEKTIATYKIVADAGGNIYKFYCDLSGALVCTTKPYKADTPEEELQLAWEMYLCWAANFTPARSPTISMKGISPIAATTGDGSLWQTAWCPRNR